MYDAQIDDSRTIFFDSSDAFFADDIETRHSSQEYDFMLFNDLVNWKSFKQRTITTSSTEVELLAISAADKEVLWWNRFFQSIEFHLDHKISIQCDNMQIIRTFIIEKLIIKLRHVNIHDHWLRQKIIKRTIKVAWIETIEIVANDFIKALRSQRHRDFVKLLKMRQLNENENDDKDHLDDLHQEDVSN